MKPIAPLFVPSGHIVLWDLSQTDPSKRVIAATTLQSEAHTEAVTGVFWRQSVVEQMRLGRANAHQLVSTSTDGQVLVWHPDSFAAPADRVSLAAGGAEVGIAAAAGNAADGGATGHVLLGSEVRGGEGGVIWGGMGCWWGKR